MLVSQEIHGFILLISKDIVVILRYKSDDIVLISAHINVYRVPNCRFEIPLFKWKTTKLGHSPFNFLSKHGEKYKKTLSLRRYEQRKLIK